MEQTNSANRLRRVRVLKRMIVAVFTTLLLLPYLFLALLFVRLQSLNSNLSMLNRRMEELAASAEEQNRLLQEWKQSGTRTGMGTVQINGADAIDSDASVQTIPEGDGKEDAVMQEAGEPKHKVYLTFDDGPSIYTDDILDVLKRYDVKATFFVVGKEDQYSKEMFRRIVEEGHTLGMHSYSHKYREIYKSEEDFKQDFEKLQQLLLQETGVESKVYRFPGGSSNTVSDVDMKVYAQYLWEMGVTYFDWNISSGDAASKMLSVDDLTENSTTGLEEWETSVILFHDSGQKQTTVEALPIIIEKILSMEDTVILPITEETTPVQHIKIN